MAQEESIFIRALSIFRKDGVRDGVNAPMDHTPSYTNNNTSAPLEKKQQEFLDWQVETINKELYGRTNYYDYDRPSAYRDFIQMDNSPEVAAALSIVRDECLTRNERGNMLEIYSENPRVKEMLKSLFKERLNVDYNMRLWIRELIKYGDFFLHLHIDGEGRKGIFDVMALPCEEIHRQEGVDGIPGNTRFWWDSKNLYFEDWQVAHFRLIEDVRRLPYGRCLRYDTYIETEKGFKFIKDINKGDTVSCFDLKTQEKTFTKVLDVVCSGEKEIIKIRSKNNELESSKEHKILICENNEFIYKSVDDLKLGDLWVVNNKKTEGKPIKLNKNLGTLKNFNGYKNSLKLIPDFVDEDFAKLYGFLLGDGWITNNMVYFALGEYPEQNEYYIGLLEKFSGKSIKFSKNPNEQGKLVYSQALVNSKMLRHILQNNGFSGKSYEKRLPEWIFNASDNIKNALLEGFIDADGSSNIDRFGCKRYQIEIANEYLAKDLKALLQSLNRKTGKICSRQRTNTKFWGKIPSSRRRAFYFYFYDSHISQSANCDIKNRITNDFIVAPIVSLEKTGETCKVYDIQVENENHNFYANGVIVHNSMLDPARKLWKQLQLAEDAMLVYRITRAPERKVFYIEAGNIDDADMPQFINQMKTRMKRQPVVDQRTGQVNLKYNPATVEEDYYIPVRGKDTGTRIDTLPGASNMNDIMDIEYLEKKLFAALQVPKPYLNYTESMPGGSMLAQADLRFARLINSIQEAVVMELRRIANVHLLFMGFEDDLDNFSLALTNPSTQQELLNLETWKTRLEVFKDMFTVEGQSPASYTWAMENILGFSKEEIKLMLKQKKVEAKIFAEIASGPETYKKIGLFDEIDKKFEDPSKAAATTPPVEGGDSGFSGGGGNPDFGLGTAETGTEELGAETTPETGTELPGAETPEAGAETTPSPEAVEEQPPISESVYFNFINELFEEDEPKPRPIVHENSLLKNNERLNFKTQKLKESMNKFKKIMDEKNKSRNEVEIDEDKIMNFSEKKSIIKEKRKKNNQ